MLNFCQSNPYSKIKSIQFSPCLTKWSLLIRRNMKSIVEVNRDQWQTLDFSEDSYSNALVETSWFSIEFFDKKARLSKRNLMEQIELLVAEKRALKNRKRNCNHCMEPPDYRGSDAKIKNPNALFEVSLTKVKIWTDVLIEKIKPVVFEEVQIEKQITMFNERFGTFGRLGLWQNYRTNWFRNQTLFNNCNTSGWDIFGSNQKCSFWQISITGESDNQRVT